MRECFEALTRYRSILVTTDVPKIQNNLLPRSSLIHFNAQALSIFHAMITVIIANLIIFGLWALASTTGGKTKLSSAILCIARFAFHGLN